jgi:hypothetical protein
MMRSGPLTRAHGSDRIAAQNGASRLPVRKLRLAIFAARVKQCARRAARDSDPLPRSALTSLAIGEETGRSAEAGVHAARTAS